MLILNCKSAVPSLEANNEGTVSLFVVVIVFGRETKDERVFAKDTHTWYIPCVPNSIVVCNVYPMQTSHQQSGHHPRTSDQKLALSSY